MEQFVKGDKVKYTHPNGNTIEGIFTGVDISDPGGCWIDAMITVQAEHCILLYPASLKWEDLKGRKVAVECNNEDQQTKCLTVMGYGLETSNYNILMCDKDDAFKKGGEFDKEYTIIPAADFIAANTVPEVVQQPEQPKQPERLPFNWDEYSKGGWQSVTRAGVKLDNISYTRDKRQPIEAGGNKYTLDGYWRTDGVDSQIDLLMYRLPDHGIAPYLAEIDRHLEAITHNLNLIKQCNK